MWRTFNADDELADREIEQCRWERMMKNGNGSHPQRFCDCAELIVNGERIACPPGHSCEYVRARSALVLDAETAALEMPGDFTRNFVAVMDQLAASLLRQSSNGHVTMPHATEATSNRILLQRAMPSNCVA